VHNAVHQHLRTPMLSCFSTVAACGGNVACKEHADTNANSYSRNSQPGFVYKAKNKKIYAMVYVQ
jgi:hypothetical protein